MTKFIEIFKNLDENSKKLLKKFLIGLGIFILLLIILIVVIKIITRKTSYVDTENIMAQAAYNYYQDNKELLPTSEVKTQVVSIQTLVDGEYMKELVKYTKNESCTGNVVVTYVDGEYDYQGYLTCDDFNTELLVDKIKNDNEIVENGNGLYKENEELLRFRGEFVNNYLKVGEEVYRIIKIDNENRMYLMPSVIKSNNEDYRSTWDDRYNKEQDSSCGINDYSVSRVKEKLNSIYENLDPTLKNKLVNFDLCIGKRTKADITTDGQVECKTKETDQRIGLLPLYEYMRASIDNGCNSFTSKECKNYNYLVMKETSWWTLTAMADDTATSYSVLSSGVIDKDKGFSKKATRFVVALRANTLYNGGKGTLEDPYTFR